ncbi:MAG: Zn-dependent hydrolase [Klebsiella sp.]|nr:Zn-dependent hydrolase [Klebsiella sp.]
MITVNGARLWSTLNEMALLGATPAGGVTRLALSEEDRQARDLLRQWAREAGFPCEVDSMGNMFIRRAGKNSQLAPVLTGSHVDSQPLGGRYDGIYGVLAGLEALRTLNDRGIETERDIVLVNWTNEEGARFAPAMLASGVWAGQFSEDFALARIDRDGISVSAALEAIGYRGECPAAAFPLHACYEVHIEQGPILEEEGVDIGLVHAAMGQRWFNVTLEGFSAHAGTTPMGYRRDTVYAFSRICHQSVEKAKKMGDPLVLTFGKVEPRPNTVNVVPGKTTFTIDCRHTDATVLRDFTQQLENDMRAICDEMDIGIDIDLWMDEEPVPMNKELVATLTELCESEKLNYRVMHSGAGHDAQIFAPRVPTCMIFIPSINGISHNPAERTNITDLAEGVKTLALMLYQLAWQK